MNFYAYNTDKCGDVPLGEESLGTDGKAIARHYKTLRGMINNLNKAGWKHFRIYTFVNFYDNKTFKEVYKQ